jgi:hypothetical protein
VSPGAVKTELLDHISVEDVKKANQSHVDQVGISASSYGRMVAFAISQPEHVDVNEIIFRPTAQELWYEENSCNTVYECSLQLVQLVSECGRIEYGNEILDY